VLWLRIGLVRLEVIPRTLLPLLSMLWPSTGPLTALTTITVPVAVSLPARCYHRFVIAAILIGGLGRRVTSFGGRLRDNLRRRRLLSGGLLLRRRKLRLGRRRRVDARSCL
jgi:hypothetical protein